MRLLNVHTLEVSDDVPRRPARSYVIASHRWMEDETTFQEVRKRKNTAKLGYRKVDGFAEFVKKNDLSVDQIWIDTCCIDKRNATELSTAINSMFKWYLESRICLAYLWDVAVRDDLAAFRGSVWFRRGWTLQELLAPRTVIFLSSDWEVIGYKGHADASLHVELCLNNMIAGITGISEVVLRNYDQSRKLSTEEKFEWIKGRETTFAEDLAYCQIGIHDVSMPIWYGGDDSGVKAMARLWDEINKARTYKAVLPPETNSELDDSEPLLISPEAACVSQVSKFGYFANQLAGIAERLTAIRTTAPLRSLEQLASSCKRLSDILRALQNFQQGSFTDVTLLMRCVHNTGRNEDDFQIMVDKIDATVATLSGNEFALADGIEPDVKILLDEVESLRGLLQFALDAYFDQRRSAQLIWSGFGAMTLASRMSLESHRDLPVHVRSMDAGSAVVKRGKRKASRYVFRTAVSWRWLSSRVCDFAVIRAQSGWDVQFRIYNQVQYDSPIFECCRSGDIQGVRDLVASGAASLQDKCGGMTLLWSAVYDGHYDLYKYLLSQMSATARTEEMAFALGAYGAAKRSLEQDVATYRLFIETYEGLDVDLDDPFGEGRGWWIDCPNNECREMIFNKMSLPWSERPLDERFHHAIDVYFGSPVEILRLCGLRPHNPRLVSLQDKRGLTALHSVAQRLERAIDSGTWARKGASIQEWIHFGSELLKDGLDPHYAPHGGVTAFILFLQAIFAWFDRETPPTYRRQQQALELWMTLVRDAGLDLRSYIERENATLRSCSIEMRRVSHYHPDGPSPVTLSRIEFHNDARRSRVKVLEVTPVKLYTCNTPPGSFNSETRLPPTIWWRPSQEEWDKGYWVSHKTVDILPTEVDTYERSNADPDPFISLIESTQDDNGLVTQLTDRGAPRMVSRARSYSAPSPINRRAVSYTTARQSQYHPWLEYYHLCPRDGRRRTVCPNSNMTWWDGEYGIIRDFRNCVKAVKHENSSSRDTIPWRDGGFLADINTCQRGLRKLGTWEKMWNERLPPLLRHNYKPDCPQGCSEVDLYEPWCLVYGTGEDDGTGEGDGNGEEESIECA